MQKTILDLLNGFSERPAAIRHELKTLAGRDPAGFRENALAAIQNRDGADGAQDGRRYLAQLLVRSAGLVPWLADPAWCDTERAIAAAKALQEAGISLEVRLDSILEAHLQDYRGGPIVNRVLDLYVALNWITHALPLRLDLTAHPDPRVRSKAAYVLARAKKDTTGVAKLLVGAEPRVQANAVEALWDAPGNDVMSVFTAAARSPHARVAANGLLGMYRRGALESVAELFRMARNDDEGRRASAIWAIGQTKDPRFLPFLARRFDEAEGKEKQRIVKALSSIRRRQRTLDQAGALQLNIFDRRVLPDGSREIAFCASTASGESPALGPLDVAVLEEGEVALDYSLASFPAPQLFILGVVMPRFLPATDPYARAVAAALNECVALKRPGDLWRVERYALTSDPRAVQNPAAEQETQENEALVQHVNKHQGFLLERQFIEMAIADPGPAARAAHDVAAAIREAAKMTARISGVRRLFVFFEKLSLPDETFKGLVEWLRGETVTLHGFAPDDAQDLARLRELCAMTPEGGLISARVDNIPELAKRVYQMLMGSYRLTYRPVEQRETRLCTLVVTSALGCGRESVEFRDTAADT